MNEPQPQHEFYLADIAHNLQFSDVDETNRHLMQPCTFLERWDVDTVQPVDDRHLSENIDQPLWFTGVEEHDLLIKGTVVTEMGVTAVKHLVSEYSPGQSKLTPLALFEAEPKEHMTMYLAMNFLLLPENDLGLELDEDMIHDAIEAKYPGAHAHVRHRYASND